MLKNITKKKRLVNITKAKSIDVFFVKKNIWRAKITRFSILFSICLVYQVKRKDPGQPRKNVVGIRGSYMRGSYMFYLVKVGVVWHSVLGVALGEREACPPRGGHFGLCHFVDPLRKRDAK